MKKIIGSIFLVIVTMICMYFILSGTYENAYKAGYCDGQNYLIEYFHECQE